MIPRIKELEEETKLIREKYKNKYLNYDENNQSIITFDNPSEWLFNLILDLDRDFYMNTSHKIMMYWGLMPNERDELMNIANEVNKNSSIKDIKIVLEKMIDKYFNILLENNINYIEVLNDDIVIKEETKDKFDKLKDYFIKKFVNREEFLRAEEAVRKNNKDLPSICIIIWNIISLIDAFIYEKMKNNKNFTMFYFPTTQEEKDEVFGICLKANYLGIVPYVNKQSVLNRLNNYGFSLIFNVLVEAIDKYFEYLTEKNISYSMEQHKFINLMNQFGDYHDLTQQELLEFAREAAKKGINVINIKTKEELDEVFKIVFPEA